MLITPCFQHSTPSHLVSLLGSRLPRQSGQGPRAPGWARLGWGRPEEGLGKVLGAARKPLLVSLGKKKSPPIVPGGRRRVRAEFRDRGMGRGTGSKVDGKGSTETQEEQLGFPERGAEKEGARGRGAAGSGRADRAVPWSSPRAWLELARLAAPLPAAPPGGSRSAPSAGALPGRALEETLDSGLVPLCPFRSAH